MVCAWTVINDSASNLVSDDTWEWRRILVEPNASHCVREVHAGSGDCDLDLAFSGRGGWALFYLQHVRAATAGDHNCAQTAQLPLKFG